MNLARSIFSATLLVVLSLAGCMSYDIRRYGSIDPQERSVTVPPGSLLLTGALKDVLQAEGWRLVIDRGPTVTEGTVGDSTRLQSYGTFNTRYRLLTSSVRYDLCLNGSPAIHYDVAFIDNRSGSEVFTLSGRGCQSIVAERFRSALRGRDR